MKINQNILEYFSINNIDYKMELIYYDVSFLKLEQKILYKFQMSKKYNYENEYNICNLKHYDHVVKFLKQNLLNRSSEIILCVIFNYDKECEGIEKLATTLWYRALRYYINTDCHQKHYSNFHISFFCNSNIDNEIIDKIIKKVLINK